MESDDQLPEAMNETLYFWTVGWTSYVDILAAPEQGEVSTAV